MPTLAEITGAEIPSAIDGISFLPTLRGRKQDKHEYLYWEFHEQGGKIAVLADNWKAVRLNADKDQQSETELYDLSKDPSEKSNIAKENPEIVRKMNEIMKKAHKPSATFPFGFEIVRN
jgi:arylsulfatase A-like enzyme